MYIVLWLNVIYSLLLGFRQSWNETDPLPLNCVTQTQINATMVTPTPTPLSTQPAKEASVRWTTGLHWRPKVERKGERKREREFKELECVSGYSTFWGHVPNLETGKGYQVLYISVLVVTFYKPFGNGHHSLWFSGRQSQKMTTVWLHLGLVAAAGQGP